MKLALLMMVCGVGCGQAPATKKSSWPQDGRCYEVRHGPCLTITHADALAIQKAILAKLDDKYLQTYPSLRAARTFAELPITESKIGAYEVIGRISEQKPGEISLFVNEVKGGGEIGYQLVLRPNTSDRSWTVVRIDEWDQELPTADLDG